MVTLADKPACADEDDSLCKTLWDWTHQGWLAGSADTIVAPVGRIVIIVVVAVVVRFLLYRLISRITKASVNGVVPVALRPLKEKAMSTRLGEAAAASLLSERRRQRAETIGSILRSTASFAVFAIAFVLVLGELGINLAPIIASAGIVGVALGFGAQNLVKDFISGMFMILEDQYGVGDIIDAQLASGTVEAVGLRTTRLRDPHGTVWYVRNGEVLRIGNKSQGVANVVLDIPVAAADVARARSSIRDLAAELWHDEEWRPSLLSEPTQSDVEERDDGTTVLRLTLVARRGDQWPVGRELRSRIGARFAADAIDSPLTSTH